MDTSKEPTYSEAEGHKPFDWNAFLASEHTNNEWADAYYLAATWTTCACGNQCAALPRNRLTGQPLDEKLVRLGLRFMDYISERDALSAQETLLEIEERSAKLLNALR